MPAAVRLDPISGSRCFLLISNGSGRAGTSLDSIGVVSMRTSTFIRQVVQVGPTMTAFAASASP
jgi:hypothetical protein